MPILFVLIIAFLFKIGIKKDKKAGITICGYVNNSFLTIRDLTKDRITAKIETIFCKIDA